MTRCESTTRRARRARRAILIVWIAVRRGVLLFAWLCGCGRLGFDGRPAIDADPGSDDAALGAPGPLGCSAPRTIAELPSVPLGLGLVATGDGAVIAWSAGVASAALVGRRLAIRDAAITASTPLSVTLPQPVGDFGLVADGDARFLLGAQIGGGALFVAFDSALAAQASSVVPGAEVTSHAVAEPVLAGGAFAAGWTAGDEAVFSLLDAQGAPTGTSHRQPAGREVALRRVAQRHMAVWRSPAIGCAVWGFDIGFVPVVPAAVDHVPGGACARPAITRHAGGINLLAWIAAADASAQRGTDSDIVGGELALGAGADDLDLALAPSGFFFAVAAGETARSGHLERAASELTAFAELPRIRGSPLRLVAHGDGALLAWIGGSASRPELMLTRLCEPAAPAARE